VFLRGVAITNDGEQPFAGAGGDVDRDPGAHGPDSHAAPRRGNSFRILPSGFVH
jgi:hypothetical protein